MINLKINGLLWDVSFISGDNPILNDTEGEECFGITLFDSLSIYIRKDLNLSVKRRVITHELTHAFIFSYGFCGDDMNEEQICNFMETYSQMICDDASLISESENVVSSKDSSKSILKRC